MSNDEPIAGAMGGPVPGTGNPPVVGVDSQPVKPAAERVVMTKAADGPQGPPPAGPQPGIALCLSGGGYRAMVFHVGVLWRLNELGFLAKLSRVSSVSGGSITAGALAIGWGGLGFDAGDVAANFHDQVVVPLLAMAGTDVDVEAALLGFLPGVDASDTVAAKYREKLFGNRTLQDLPDPPAPDFVINATNLQSGALWRFTKPYMWDWRVGEVKNPRLELAVAVAASSAFPPVLSPVRLRLQNGDFVPGSGTPELQRPPFTTDVFLADGGVYDNLGLEPAWKTFQTILVSDGGKAFGFEEQPETGKLGQTLRVLDVIQNQVHALRTRELVSSYQAKERQGAYWGINTRIADYKAPGALACPPDKTAVLAAQATRLAALPQATQERLVNWGYAVCDAAMRAYADKTLPPPGGFPYPAQGVG